MRLVLRNLPPVKKATELSGRIRPQTFAAAPGWERLTACTVALFNLRAAPQTSWHQNLPWWQTSTALSLQKSSGYSAAAGTGAKQQRQSAFECNQTWVFALKAGGECQEDNLSANRMSGPRARQYASLHWPTRPPLPPSVQENAGSFYQDLKPRPLVFQYFKDTQTVTVATMGEG